MTKQIKATATQVKQELFRRGELSWLLYKHQRPIYDKIREVLKSSETDDNSYVIDCARQYGKSFTMFTIAVEECLRSPFHTIVYVAPLKSQVVEIVTEKTFRTVFEYAPPECIPKLDGSALVFANGSRIRLAGTDNKNYANLRGGIAHHVLLDEAGFMSDLDTGVLPSVTPMLKTTGGKIIFASTPPENLDHPYLEILREHDESGHISTYTIWDDKSLTEKQLNKIISDCKGRDSTLFKREYECRRIAESSQQVLPELSLEVSQRILYKDNRYKEDDLLQYWQKYIVADWGGKDFTAIIFAHYNYHTKKVVVEDQLNLTGSLISSGRIAAEIKAKTTELWPDPNYRRQVQYYCDSNNVLIQNDMINTYHLPFVSTSKDRLAEQMVQKVRDWIYDDRIDFAQAAEFTMKSCMSGWWSKGKDKFAHSKIYGHYDHLAALIYLIRNVNTNADPLPRTLGLNPHTHYIDPLYGSNQVGAQKELREIFNPRKGLSFRK